MSDSRSYPDPTQHPEVANWIKTLDANPADQLPRLQFADWLQEHGYDNAAKWQRLFADQGKYPHTYMNSEADEDTAGMSSGWYPSSFRGYPNIAHAALPNMFQIGTFEHPAPEGQRDWYHHVIYGDEDAHPEHAILSAMHHIPYDKYNKTTTKD